MRRFNLRLNIFVIDKLWWLRTISRCNATIIPVKWDLTYHPLLQVNMHTLKLEYKSYNLKCLKNKERPINGAQQISRRPVSVFTSVRPWSSNNIVSTNWFPLCFIQALVSVRRVLSLWARFFYIIYSYSLFIYILSSRYTVQSILEVLMNLVYSVNDQNFVNANKT